MENYKIMCVGNQNIPQASEQTVSRDLVRQCHKVISFQYPTNGIENYTAINKQLTKKIEIEKPDFVLCHKCPGLSNEDINNIRRKLKTPVVSWNFDLFNGYVADFKPENYIFQRRINSYEQQISAYDVAFGAEAGKKEIDRYRDEDGANYHPLKLGADPEWFNKIPDYDTEIHKLNCDVSFLGSIYNRLRKQMNTKLLSIPNISYKQFTGYKIRGIVQPEIFMKDISKFANVCKISIGCNYRNDVEGYWSKRCYELMGANHFMIQAHVKGMKKEGFKHKKNTVFYYDDDFEEMTELIQYYLDNEKERNKIREQGFKLIREKHLQSNRTKDFFKTLKKEGVI